MARKSVIDGGKRDEIIKAALNLFLEKGYEGTSIRMIQNKVGSEVGLFYYYFKNKDEVFEKAINLFFNSFDEECAKIVELGNRDPFRLMTKFFQHLEDWNQNLQKEYANKLHWTVSKAIIEHTLEVIEPYLRQIIDILVANGAKPKLDLEVATMFLTHGVGSLILHKEYETYAINRKEVIHGVNLIMGLDLDTSELMFPQIADQDDIDNCMQLIDNVESSFPNINKANFKEKLIKYINTQQALVIRYNGIIAGLILISKERYEIDFLAVQPEFRRKGIATRLLTSCLAIFPTQSKVSVVTYREGDALGINARCFYKKAGFCNGELLEKFEYPCQRLTLNITNQNNIINR